MTGTSSEEGVRDGRRLSGGKGMSIRHTITHKRGGLRYLLGTILAATLLSGSAQGFFPALPPTNNLNRGGTVPPPPAPPTSRTFPGPGGMPPGSGAPPTAMPPQGGSQTPVGPPGGTTPPTIPFPPPPPPPGVPEIDPGSLAGALGILISGALMLLDRRRR
jgi:hypothetical protein